MLGRLSVWQILSCGHPIFRTVHFTDRFFLPNLPMLSAQQPQRLAVFLVCVLVCGFFSVPANLGFVFLFLLSPNLSSLL